MAESRLHRLYRLAPLPRRAETRSSGNDRDAFPGRSHFRPPANGGGESAGTPDSVPGLAARWRPSFSAGGCPTALAAYPGVIGRDHPLPVRPCSGWGLQSHPSHPGCWCALTAPFHPCLCGGHVSSRVDVPPPSAVCSLLHFPAGHPGWALPSTLPCGVRTFLGRVTTARAVPYAAAWPTRHRCRFNHTRAPTRRGARCTARAIRRARAKAAPDDPDISALPRGRGRCIRR